MTTSDSATQFSPCRTFRLPGCIIAFLVLTINALAQEARISGDIIGKGGKPKMAVTDFRGTGRSAGFMSTFNSTLFADLQSSGLFDMVSKSLYPLQPPQRPEDLRPESGVGLALKDWSSPPPNASHVAFGYTADQGGTFVIYGYLFDARQNLQGAQMLAKRYFETMDDNGARKGAHEFANDIIAMFGGGTLNGTKIYFISNRTGNKEVWVMDYDGSNVRQLTHSRSINIMPGISPDGSAVTRGSSGTRWNTKSDEQRNGPSPQSRAGLAGA